MYEGTRYGPPQHPQRTVQGPDAYNTTNGRQDKSADLGQAHVVGRVRFFWDWTNRADWRLRYKVQRIQRTERCHPPFGGLLLP
jgi:hypothetical protein